MKEFKIGDLQLIANSEASPGYILQTPIEGLDSPKYRTNAYEKSGQDGQVVSSMFYDMRIVTLQGKIHADNAVAYEQYRRNFADACAINKNDDNYPIPTRVTFKTLADNEYFFDAYIDQPLMDLDNPNWTDFQVSMNVTDPFIYGATQFVSSAVSPPTGGGFILPVILPIISSPAVGGIVTVTNDGAVASFPIITLSGQLTNPYIYNSTTGKFLKLNYTLAAGDSIVIDMLKRTITLNESSSLLSTKTADSDWWTIAKGPNQIGLTTDSGGDNGYAIASFYPGYLAV